MLEERQLPLHLCFVSSSSCLGVEWLLAGSPPPALGSPAPTSHQLAPWWKGRSFSLGQASERVCLSPGFRMTFSTVHAQSLRLVSGPVVPFWNRRAVVKQAECAGWEAGEAGLQRRRTAWAERGGRPVAREPSRCPVDTAQALPALINEWRPEPWRGTALLFCRHYKSEENKQSFGQKNPSSLASPTRGELQPLDRSSRDGLGNSSSWNHGGGRRNTGGGGHGPPRHTRD